MIIPSTRYFTAGEVETGAYLNASVTNLGNFMLGRPIAQLRQATTATTMATSGTTYDINFDTEDIDRDNAHSLATNTNRYTPQTAGWYFISGGVSFAGNATGNRVVSFVTNAGTANVGSNRNSSALLAGNAFVIPVSTFMYFNGTTDWVGLQAVQSSGGSLSTVLTAGFQSFMTVVWVSL